MMSAQRKDYSWLSTMELVGKKAGGYIKDKSFNIYVMDCNVVINENGYVRYQFKTPTYSDWCFWHEKLYMNKIITFNTLEVHVHNQRREETNNTFPQIRSLAPFQTN